MVTICEVRLDIGLAGRGEAEGWCADGKIRLRLLQMSGSTIGFSVARVVSTLRWALT